MLFKQIDKKDILRIIKENISKAKKEIFATMLLKEELKTPLPASYFNLLRKKINDRVFFKRLGFGRKEDYNKIKERNKLKNNNYEFRYIIQEHKYQRLIIIDEEKLFFGIDGLYFTSKHKPFVKVFIKYFSYNFKKGKL